jgi:hypothetical protein
MVTPITPIPSFDVYYGINNATPGSVKQGDNSITIIFVGLSIGLACVSAYLIYKNIELNIKLKEIHT